MLTIIADSNVAHLTTYFNANTLGHPINLVSMAGRDINRAVIDQYQPDALIIRSVTRVNNDLLKNNDSVKFVGSATIGTDHVDQDYMREQGIRFANAAGCSKHSVAQYVISAITTLHPDYWQTPSPSFAPVSTSFAPIKLGIIGLGNIGSTLSQYAKDLGWTILGYDPFLPASSINNSSLAELLTQSDVVSLHVPLTTSRASPYPTYHLLNSVTLAQLKPNALIINTARGAVIKEQALISALNVKASKQQAVLDVFEHEPVVPANLLQHLAIATPHIAGYTIEGKLRGTQMVFDQFVSYFSNKLTVKQTYLMDALLPDNPYHWAQLQAQPTKLAQFYNICQDDSLLRGAVTTTVTTINQDQDQRINNTIAQVLSSDFDALRKNYLLRREWIYQDNTANG